jgi:hypothetical protein
MTIEAQTPPEDVEAPNPPATDRLAVYPGRMIRPIPGFVFTVPQGWVMDEAPDALCVVRTPKEVDGFWVNALLSHNRVSRSVDFKAAASTTWQRIKRSSPDAEVQMERLVRFGTNVVYLRGVELPAPESGRSLNQLQALFFAPVEETGKTVDFFQFLCTAPEELMDNFGSPFMEMIGSFRFT